MTSNRSSFVVLLLTVAAMVILLAACSQPAPQPQPAPTPAPAPAAKPKPAYTNGEVPIGDCHKPANHGSSGQFEVVQACQTATTAPACANSVTTFDVDAFLADPNGAGDVPVCLKYGSGPDAVTYTTAKAGRTIRIFRYDTNGPAGWKDGDPFVTSPPYPALLPGRQAVSAKLDTRLTPAPGTCWRFRTYIWVKDQGEQPKCYDPHIYTSCDPDCSISTDGGKHH